MISRVLSNVTVCFKLNFSFHRHFTKLLNRVSNILVSGVGFLSENVYISKLKCSRGLRPRTTGEVRKNGPSKQQLSLI